MKKVASIELLRFISAIMVLIWHYQQFYLPINLFSDNEILVSSRDQQPFYDYLSFFFNIPSGNDWISLNLPKSKTSVTLMHITVFKDNLLSTGSQFFS